MRLEFNMRDFAGPKMDRIAREMPHMIDDALRMTVARHRRRLVKFIKQNEANYGNKTQLNDAARKRLTESGASPETIRKHIHRSERPFSGVSGRHFADATRYRRTSRLGYSFGFIGGAEKWADLLARGLFMNPKTKAVGNGVIRSMRGYFSKIGIGLKKGTTSLNYKPKPVVEDYIKRNKIRMLSDFQSILYGKYNRAMGKSDRMNFTSVRTRA